jgi:hypothetical protein
MSMLMTKLLGGAGLLLSIFVGIFAIRRDAVKDDRKDGHIKDLENAEDIRRRADTADQRLRDHDDAGWRD